MFKKFFSTILVILFCTISLSSYAFDGERKGFILGIGAGGGLVIPFMTYETYDRVYNGYWGYSWERVEKTDKDLYGALATDFKIGYAPSNTLQLYWQSKVSWVEFWEGEDMAVTGVAGIGGSYFFKPSAPSSYLTGGLGYSSWAWPFDEQGDESYNGFGLSLGIGHEFNRHWSLEGNLTWGNPKDGSIEFKPLALRITLNVLAY